ncbi:MAG: methyltransferase domain-containing protein [Candidatus Eisenbacteria bacterium]|uniref:Methyltransferase domain-containing protein n=1 Tax=Eiseniibacteriota bacterium TaxID=2212470 RepID=A0A933W7K9_UNCEI|nr:methyltransferase domain-containing protein [Candidatus Eisenbacteria bacterium]
MSARFDPARDEHVALFDEAPLWSALAGQLLLEHVPLSAARALDLGCGAGFPLFELAERLGPRAFAAGVDPWETALRRANAKRATWPVRNAALVRGDGAHLPFRDGAFDLVASNLGVNNFSDPGAAFDECRRVLAPGGALALSTNLVGHFAELYAAFERVLERTGDGAAHERLRAHVAHRATVAGLRDTLARHGFSVASVHERVVPWRFASGGAVLAHHFVELGFMDAWRAVAGERADETLGALAAELDATPGGVTLSVPLAVVVAAKA